LTEEQLRDPDQLKKLRINKYIPLPDDYLMFPTKDRKVAEWYCRHFINDLKEFKETYISKTSEDELLSPAG
jgi:hypothetical protein